MKIFLAVILFFMTISVALGQWQRAQVVSGKGVFFFGPSVAEADTISAEYSDALSNFAYYTDAFAKLARANGIHCEYVSSRKIIVQYATIKQFIVDRDTVEFGTIFSDGNRRPLLLKYVLTDSVLNQEGKKYFHYQ